MRQENNYNVGNKNVDYQANLMRLYVVENWRKSTTKLLYSTILQMMEREAV